MKFQNVSGKTKTFKRDGEFFTVEADANFEFPSEIDKNEEGIKRIDDKAKVNYDAEKRVYKVLQKKSTAKRHTKSKPSEPKLELFDTKELSKLTKDELNDYAAKRNLGNIQSRWLKSKMIKEVLKLQNAKT